jgi:hypothetical protein
MSKKVVILLVVMGAVLSLAGCGGSNPGPTFTSVTVSAAVSSTPNGISAPLSPGQTVQLSAMANYSDGLSYALTNCWTSGNTAVATVNSSGLATAVSGGTAQITCTAPQGKSASVTLTVVNNISGTVTGAGGTITADANSPLVGVTVAVPNGAVDTSDNVKITAEYSTTLPATLPTGATQASKVLSLDKSVSYDFAQPLSVTLPVDSAALQNGDVPIVLYWSPTYNMYRATSVESVDRTNNTVTFETSHFSKYVAAFIPGIVSAASKNLGVDSGFTPGTDGFMHPNFGSYEYPGGSGLGMTLFAEWYYGSKKKGDGTALYDKWQEGDPNSWQDDECIRELVSRSFLASSRVWGDISSINKKRPSDSDTAAALLTAMILTKEPQPLLLKGSTSSQAVLVYKWDPATGKFYIYDNNFPNEAVTLNWSSSSGFSGYSKAKAYSWTIKSYAFEGMGVALEGSEFEDYYSGAQNGWSSTRFGQVVLTTPTPDSKNVATVLNDTNVAVTGTVTGGVKTPTYVVYYLNGLRQEAVALKNGGFSFTIGKLPRGSNGLMLLATDNPKDPWSSVGGFGEYTIKVQGNIFIQNPGFETGDWTGWTHESHLWYDTTPFSYKPEKNAIVTKGDTDDIDSTLSVVYAGQYSARVNNYDPNYHASSVSQTIAVPTTVAHPELRFYWAAVLEDPQHDAANQPFVDISVTDVTGGTTLYYSHFYSNDPAYPGWISLYGGGWKEIPWQTVIVDLSSVVGHTVTIKITASDCGYGGHGGYVYFDGDTN